MVRIPLDVAPTGLSPEEEDKIVKMLEEAGKQSRRAIGCIETLKIFDLDKDEQEVKQ